MAHIKYWRTTRIRYGEHLAHLKYRGSQNLSVAHQVLKTGYSVDKSSFKLIRHMIDIRLLNAYEILDEIEGDNLFYADSGPFHFSCLYSFFVITNKHNMYLSIFNKKDMPFSIKKNCLWNLFISLLPLKDRPGDWIRA